MCSRDHLVAAAVKAQPPHSIATMATGCTEIEARERTALLDIQSYDVRLDLTDADAVRSHTEIRFSCRAPGASTFADLATGTLRSAVLNGDQIGSDAATPDDRLLLESLQANNVLAVEAEVPYWHDNRGMSRFSDPADGRDYVLAYCYPTAAPRVFCCFDQPDLGADFTVRLAVPQGWECIGNAPVTKRPANDQSGVWEFATVGAMKPYELALCCGPYVTACRAEFDGAETKIPVTVRCRTSLAGSADLSRAAEVVTKALGYYEQLLGVPCPCDKFDVVFAPDIAPMAAQVPGLMLVNELLVHRVVDAGDGFVTMVLGHEVSHLWFGCLVEGRWWDDLWLAEALATYLSMAAGEEALGMDSPWAEFALRDQQAAYTADKLPNTQPVSSPVASAADALSRPSGITYSKGASVIRQLAALIGDESLRAGLRDYLTTHAGQTATMSDLIECWGKASGRDLNGWAEQWFRKPGTNTLRPEVQLASDGTVESFAGKRRRAAGGATTAATAPSCHRLVRPRR
jgi:aminopeptidase N